jgi:hypothetical protein
MHSFGVWVANYIANEGQRCCYDATLAHGDDLSDVVIRRILYYDTL